MSTEKHTKEPWHAGGTYGVNDIQGRRLALCRNASGITDCNPDEAEANTRRIVACVNACAGIYDPQAAIQAARGALTELASLDDGPANQHLERTGKFSMFDEPNAVQVARRVLALLGGGR